MKNQLLLIVCCLLCSHSLYGQEVYELDPKYPVHDLNSSLKVYADSTNSFSNEFILNERALSYKPGDQLPRLLESNVTYWGKITIRAIDSLSGWKLHFEDKMIGPPAWTKSNGKVDVYAYVGDKLLWQQKTGVDYKKKLRSTKEHWVLNSIDLATIPLDQTTTLIIKAQGNSFGYPAYFNLSARSPMQPYYHQIYQFNNSFNIFMFGVTFIIFLYHILQFLYVRDRVYFWFSLWLFAVMFTHAMAIGFFIGNAPQIRYYLWLIVANSIFFTFWFFGRAFVDSKKKYPILDKFILGLALLVFLEVIMTAIYIIIFNPLRDFTGPGIHFIILNIYAIASLILSIILTFKKDLFARYFGIGSLIMSIFLIIGSLWSLNILRMPVPIDPYSTGMFLQIIIYSFGIAFRRQKLNEKNQQERLEGEQSMAEMQRMKDLDEIKTRFFANISHEFRTPLTLITAPLERVKRLSSNKTGDSVLLTDKVYAVIKKNANRLQILVDQLLDISKIESGTVHLNLAQGGLIQFIRSIVFSFESMAERQNISLNTNFSEELDTAFYDKDKLEKIITNLLSNAFKYTPKSGAVSVTINHTSKNISIEISDTGKGIHKEEIDKIFDRFYRVEGTEIKGSGIGLALTKELVNLQNGQISVHSKKGRGTTFKIRLPITLDGLPETVVVQNTDKSIATIDYVAIVENNKNGEDVRAVQGHENVVLLVEDNKDLQDFISKILESHYTILTADDGLQGERMAFEHIPDLVISDVMMPKKDGYELCNSLKNNIKTSHIPIIMLTAKAGQANKIAGLTQGAEAYITKPFDADELLLRVKNLIEARKKIWEHFKLLDLAFIDDLDLKSADDTFLQKVVKIIKDNLDNEMLSVEDIASKVGFSRAQLHRKLKALINKSTGQLISEIRLNEAKAMLEKKVGSVSEVAYSVGYSNMSYFTKSFKQKFGILPSKV